MLRNFKLLLLLTSAIIYKEDLQTKITKYFYFYISTFVSCLKVGEESKFL